MLKRVIIKSLLARKKHLLIAAAAVLLAATLIASLVTLSAGMKTKGSQELEAYGANIILLPEITTLPAGAGGLNFGNVIADTYINESLLSPLESGQMDGVVSYAPYLYTIASYEGQKVVLTGTIFARLRELAPYWRIEGEWGNDNRNGDSSVIGRKVAQRFNLHPNDRFRLESGGTSQDFSVAGIADVGGSEDNQIFINLKTAQLLSGRDGQIDLVQIRASNEKRPLVETAAELEKKHSVKAKVISQIADAEARVLFKVELLMTLITLLTLLASGVAVFSTLTTSVLERVKEIGLMKALGARNSRIALIFLAEAWTIGLVGGLLGNVFGLGMAQAIAKSVFDSYLAPAVSVIPLTVAAALAVATIASLGPVRTALTVDPVITLRGE